MLVHHSLTVYSTFLVPRPLYTQKTNSIPWISMPLNFALLDNQYPSISLCRMNASLSSPGKVYNCLWHLSVAKMKANINIILCTFKMVKHIKCYDKTYLLHQSRWTDRIDNEKTVKIRTNNIFMSAGISWVRTFHDESFRILSSNC